MPSGWSAKRERQYEHIKREYQERGGRSAARAKEIAARTVNDQRAKAGEVPTRDELYRRAKRLDIRGRSKMNKAQLQRAISRAS